MESEQWKRDAAQLSSSCMICRMLPIAAFLVCVQAEQRRLLPLQQYQQFAVNNPMTDISQAEWRLASELVASRAFAVASHLGMCLHSEYSTRMLIG